MPTKMQLIREVSKRTGIEAILVEASIESFMAAVKEHVAKKEMVSLRGFGNFKVKKRAAKTVQNITAGKSMHMDAHFIPWFKPSPKFKEETKKIKCKQ